MQNKYQSNNKFKNHNNEKMGERRGYNDFKKKNYFVRNEDSMENRMEKRMEKRMENKIENKFDIDLKEGSLTREEIVKFFTRNKKKKIEIPESNSFWDDWECTNFQKEPLINNILSCILEAHNQLQYNLDGNPSNMNDEILDKIKEILQDRNLQQSLWSKKKIFESINLSNIYNDFFLFLCQEFYINIIICSEIGIKFYYLDEEFDKFIPTIVLKSITDEITKQVYYQLIYKNNKIIDQENLIKFMNSNEKYIIGLEKNKKFIVKNYSLIEEDKDVIQFDINRIMDKISSEKSDDDLYNEFIEE